MGTGVKLEADVMGEHLVGLGDAYVILGAEVVNLNTGWTVAAGPGKPWKKIVAKKGTSLSPLLLHNPEGVPLESHSWGARRSGGDREGGNGTQPRVAAARGKSISDVGEGRVRRTGSSWNPAHGRSLPSLAWVLTEEESKNRSLAGEGSAHCTACWQMFFPLPAWRALLWPFCLLPSAPFPRPPVPH